MDNLTHSMAGWALGQAGLKTKTRKGLAALILGAVVVLTGVRPDVATTLVTLGIDLSGVFTLGTLQSGIAFSMRHKWAHGSP